MNKKTLLLLVMGIFLLSVPAFSAEKMRIALLDLKPDDVPAKTARVVSSMLRTEFINLKKFLVIERSQMQEIIKEQGIQHSGCTDQDCAVQLGRLLSSKKVLLGEVTSLGQSIIINVRIVDVEKGVSEYAAKEKAASEDALERAVYKLARKLAARITIKGDDASGYESDAALSSSGYYSRGIVFPGWGQFYSGRSAKGYIFLSSFVLSGAFMGYAVYDFTVKRGDYEDMKTGDFQDKLDKSDKALSLAYISIGICSAVYAANLIDIFFFSKPSSFEVSRGSGSLKLDNTYLSFNTFQPSGYNKGRYFDVTVSTRF